MIHVPVRPRPALHSVRWNTKEKKPEAGAPDAMNPLFLLYSKAGVLVGAGVQIHRGARRSPRSRAQNYLATAAGTQWHRSQHLLHGAFARLVHRAYGVPLGDREPWRALLSALRGAAKPRDPGLLDQKGCRVSRAAAAHPPLMHSRLRRHVPLAYKSMLRPCVLTTTVSCCRRIAAPPPA